MLPPFSQQLRGENPPCISHIFMFALTDSALWKFSLLFVSHVCKLSRVPAEPSNIPPPCICRCRPELWTGLYTSCPFHACSLNLVSFPAKKCPPSLQSSSRNSYFESHHADVRHTSVLHISCHLNFRSPVLPGHCWLARPLRYRLHPTYSLCHKLSCISVLLVW